MSVCLPTFNRGRCLGDAIRSVLAQCFDDYELVVVDNASTDDTQSVIGSFDDPRIRNLRFSTTVSMYANHNRCVRSAQGEWVAFLHSDDQYPPDYLRRLAAELRSSPPADIVCNAQYPLGEHPLALQPGSNEPLKTLAFTVIMDGHSPSGSAYRRERFAEYGYFNEESLFADGVLIAQWASRGAVLRVFQFEPPVWQKTTTSELNAMEARPDYYSYAAPILDAAFRGPMARDVTQLLVARAAELPPRRQARLLRRLYQCGYRQEGRAVWSAVRPMWRLRSERQFLFHAAPLRFVPWIYWPMALNWRRLKQFLRRVRS
ncbi:MAG: hypothetical protein DCC67_05400 [Planctomycetota bacterium]|nr:MAG: hypothetical protein DCC67_05400 [Planctomycetota bacterium]